MVKSTKKTPRKRREMQTSAVIAWREALDIPHHAVSVAVSLVHDPLERCNATERLYYDTFIKPKIDRGDIVDYGYEVLIFQLGYKQTYRPDFYTIDREGKLELHEIKGGYIYPDAYEKLKAFVTIFPMFPIKLAQYKKATGWKIETVPHR